MTRLSVDIPVIETERLVLREPRLADFETFAAFMASDRSATVRGPVNRAEAWAGFCAAAGQWMMRGHGQWIAQRRDTGSAAIMCGIYHPDDWPEPELAWAVLDADAEGRGLAREAAMAARDAARDLWGMTGVISSIFPGNERSIRLAERMGARFERRWDSPRFGEMLIYRHPKEDA